MKRPSFQFYPADWRKDSALSTCSMASRGLWIELMCMAHEGEYYGVLSIAGKPMTAQQIARGVGESVSVVSKLIAELEASGVFSRDEQGCIFSRRMVRDEHIRNVRGEAGRLGGNPKLIGGLLKQNKEQRPTPSSSSSSSSSPSGGENALARDPPPILGISPEQKAWAAEERPDIDVDSVAENFVSYHSDKGTTPDDSGWRKWVRKEHPPRVNGHYVVAVPCLTVPSNEADRTAERLSRQGMTAAEREASDAARIEFMRNARATA